MVAWLHLTCQPLLRGYNTLLDFNSELEGIEYAMSSKAIVTTLLDAVIVYDFTYVRNFKTNNKSLIDDHNKVWDELSVVLEDSDRRKAMVRAQEQRNAYYTLKRPRVQIWLRCCRHWLMPSLLTCLHHRRRRPFPIVREVWHSTPRRLHRGTGCVG